MLAKAEQLLEIATGNDALLFCRLSSGFVQSDFPGACTVSREWGGGGSGSFLESGQIRLSFMVWNAPYVAAIHPSWRAILPLPRIHHSTTMLVGSHVHMVRETL